MGLGCRALVGLAILSCCVIHVLAEPPEQKIKFLINPDGVYSHWLPMLRISRELEARGHQLKYIYSSDVEYLADKFNLQAAARIPFPCQYAAQDLMDGITQLKSEGREAEMFKSLMPKWYDYTRGAIEDNATIAAVREYAPDLIFFDGGFPSAAPIGDLLGIPYVAFHVFSPLGSLFNYPAGTPSVPSLIPSFPGVIWAKQPMGLIGRFKSLASWALGMFIVQSFDKNYSPLWTQHGMPDMSYVKCLRKASAWIFQGDFALLPAIPMSPHAHVLGSLTAEPAQPLQGKLRAFCDAALDTGVIFISSGSSATPDVRMLTGIQQAVSTVKASVVWKLTAGDQQKMKEHNVSIPKNVLVVEFAPQNDLLGHPAVRGFVTQGGGNSYHEAWYHAVPMIIIPLYGEQPWHAKQVEALGAGLGIHIASPIDIAQLARLLSAAFTKLLATDDYLNTARRYSQLMRAERWTPVEKAASVLEHAGWTKGSPHNQMLQHGQSFIAVHNLDLFAIIFMLLAGVLLLLLWAKDD
ncbi:hypothetical protein WJX73_003384 [Symbiochloris irregularis]|uniref:Uncharacterized protein n=1 Tax=Symbiochloris irregularis TaxID=706552 RepID=A0AAW1NW47_9CHLO